MINKKIIENAHKLLSLVLKDDILFTNAKTTIFKTLKVSDSERREIVRLAGSELRHHIALSHLAKQLFDELDETLLIHVLLMFANNAYALSLPKKEYVDFINNLLIENNVDYDKKSFTDFCLDEQFKQNIISKKIKQTSIQYLSLRYNTPSWVCKMWQKQFGHKILINTLRSFMKPSTTTVRVEGDVDEFISSHNGFTKTDVDSILEYTGDEPFKKTNAYLNHEAYLQKKIIKQLFDKLPIDEYKNYGLYLGSSVPVYRELVTRFGKNIQLDILFLTFQDYYKAKKDYYLKNSNKIKIYESNPSMIKSCISEGVDLFFALPRSTNFDLFRVFPDYFLRCKQDELDTIINEQNTLLDQASLIINNNGYLVYAVFTLNKKETKNVINNFLSSHKDFILLEENQLFSFDDNRSIAYYAVMKKEVNND